MIRYNERIYYSFVEFEQEIRLELPNSRVADTHRS